METMVTEGRPGWANALLFDNVKGNGENDDAAGLQVALDSGASVVYFPPPSVRYVIGRALEIHSCQTLMIDRHTTIRLKKQANDEMLTNSDHANGNHDIRIVGGIWDGNNAEQTRGDTDIAAFDPNLFTGTVIRFNNVKRLDISDLTVKDPESMSIQIGNIHQFTVDNITFDSNNLRLNMDGLHLNGPCRHGRITNLKHPANANDDFLALCADDGPWGEMTRGPIEDISVDCLSCEHGHTGVRLLSAGSPVRRIRISNIFGDFQYYAVYFTHHYVRPISPGDSLFEDIVVDGVFASKRADAKARDKGLGADDEDARAAKIVKEGLSEYFIFTVEGAQTVKNGWSQRMVSFRARQVPFRILYRYRRHQYGARPVRFFIFTNDAEHNLGESPLPDGRVRLFRDNGRVGSTNRVRILTRNSGGRIKKRFDLSSCHQ